MESHSEAFFSKPSGMGFIFESESASDRTWRIRCLRRHDDGTWDSLREAKSVKMNLLELTGIVRALQTATPWKTFHSYSPGGGKPTIKTTIEVVPQATTTRLTVGDFSRSFNEIEKILLCKLLEHIWEEKVANATTYRRADPNVPVEVGDDAEESSSADMPDIEPEEGEIAHPPAKKTTAPPAVTSTAPRAQNRSTGTTHTPPAAVTGENGTIAAAMGLEISDGNGTTQILVSVKRVTERGGVLLEHAAAGEFWIPKSALIEPYDLSAPEEQEIQVKNFFLLKPHKPRQ